MSTLCDTITKVDDIIKIKYQAPAVEKRKKINKGCLKKTAYQVNKVQLHAVVISSWGL